MTQAEIYYNKAKKNFNARTRIEKNRYIKDLSVWLANNPNPVNKDKKEAIARFLVDFSSK